MEKEEAEEVEQEWGKEKKTTLLFISPSESKGIYTI